MTATVRFDWLREEFETLVSAYRYPERDGDYAAWETWLAEFPRWAVKAVVFQAPDRWPGAMPTVGELRRAVSEALAKRRNAERDKRPRPQSEGPTSSPIHPAFLELAESFELESRRLGLDPDEPSPQHIAIARAHAISDLFGKYSKIGALSGEGVGFQTNPIQKRARPPE
ncbi:hypothetical protein LCGC14_2191460 [marine sediment metagenome]|uniref:Uncharacterized protein n=1 Tax=marine sediment metagenome TaxID=412755 RepID=A0A0F9GFB0_9ZZZZ